MTIKIPPPHPSFNVGLNDRADAGMVWINIEMGSGVLKIGHKHDKYANTFFPDCLSKILKLSSEIGFLAISREFLQIIGPNFTQILI